MKRRAIDRDGVLRAAAATVAVLSIAALAGTPALAHGSKSNGSKPGGDHEHGGVCKEVAQDTQRSCWNGARDEYWVAIARCDNAPDATDARHDGSDSCEKDARDALQSSHQDCRDQLAARNDVCDLLGGGAYAPDIDPANFGATIDNPYMPLVPGTTFHYESQTADGLEKDDVEVTHDTRTILGVACVVVHDTVKLEDEVTEDTLDWFAQDQAGNVWYFGEESKQFADGVLVGIEGSWMGGVDGALPGIVMEAHPAVGDVYRQEFAVGEAEDMAQVLALGQSASVPDGSFTNALQTREFSALEPGADENKFYAPNVGMVLTVDLTTGDRQELVSITP